MNTDELDAELLQGLISEAGMKALVDAEVYGTATPMQWLQKRLQIIEGVIASGQSVHARFKHYKYGEQHMVLSSHQEYSEWCAHFLPGAWSCFVRPRNAAQPSVPLDVPAAASRRQGRE